MSVMVIAIKLAAVWICVVSVMLVLSSWRLPGFDIYISFRLGRHVVTILFAATLVSLYVVLRACGYLT